MAVTKNGLVRFQSRDLVDRPATGQEERIQELAYFKALERRFAPGHELDDWLAAEEEVNSTPGRLMEN